MSRNCAALSCPNLRAAAYTGEEIEAQLDAAAFAYINNFRGVEVSGKGEVIASRIYQWYEDDWGGEAEVLAEFRKYAAQTEFAGGHQCGYHQQNVQMTGRT